MKRPKQKKPPLGQQVRTVAHLAWTAADHQAHVERHSRSFIAGSSKTARAFDADHVRKHSKASAEHLRKLAHEVRKLPGVAREQGVMTRTSKRLMGR